LKTKKLHILKLPSWYTSNFAPIGGRFVADQAQILKSKGVETNVLANVSLTIKNDKAEYFILPYRAFLSEENGLSVFRHYFRCLPKFPKPFNAKRWIKSTLKLFEKYQAQFGKPDLIHVHSAIWGGCAAALIKEKYGIPYIITEHRGIFGQSCEYAKNTFKDWQTPFLEKAFSEAAAIIPVSENLTPKIQSFLNKKVSIIPISNVLDTDFFHYKKRDKSEKIRFITTNNFSIAKAYDILFPAFDSACNEIPNLELTICGKNFWNNQEFEKIWQKIKNKNNFRFVGFKNSKEVRSELWQADIFVLASRVEAQPVAVLEALSSGLPIVCTAVVPKIVATAENSIVVPVENEEKLQNAITEMAKNYQKYNGKAISEHIKSVAGKEAFAKAIMEVYEQVLSEK